ncbi:MAG: invasion associated locus B family protein [Beijerinckiaceae bacterium]
MMGFVRTKTQALKAGLAATAILATAGIALAQQPARPAQRPAAPPAAPQPAAPPPQIVELKGEPTQKDWIKICGKDPSVNAEVCYTTRDFISDQGQPVLAVAVYDVKGAKPAENARVVRILLPLMLMLRNGILVGVDNGKPTNGNFAICMPNGCFAEVPAVDDAMLNALKRGQKFNISVRNQVGTEVTFAAPLDGFGKAFDGPAIDPAVLEKQRQDLENQMKLEAEKLRQQSGAAPAPAAPAAPAPAAPAAPAAPKQ